MQSDIIQVLKNMQSDSHGRICKSILQNQLQPEKLHSSTTSMMPLAAGVTFNHVSRECADVKRLAQFYIELFGFKQVESPKFEFDVIWLKLPTFFLHLIERNPNSRLPEGPWSSTSAMADVKHLGRGHHICFSISNLDSFVHTLKVEMCERQSISFSQLISQMFEGGMCSGSKSQNHPSTAGSSGVAYQFSP